MLIELPVFLLHRAFVVAFIVLPLTTTLTRPVNYSVGRFVCFPGGLESSEINTSRVALLAEGGFFSTVSPEMTINKISTTGLSSSVKGIPYPRIVGSVCWTCLRSHTQMHPFKRVKGNADPRETMVFIK